MELQVTEHSVCGSRTLSHRIFYVWNISGSLCNSPKDTGVQGRRPLGLEGAVIYWRCNLLGFFFIFSVIIKQ